MSTLKNVKNFVRENKTALILGLCVGTIAYSTILYDGAVKERRQTKSHLEAFRDRPLYVTVASPAQMH